MSMDIDDMKDELSPEEVEANSEELQHYGTPRHSGRYPWGSGENPYQRYADFLGNVKKLEDKGMSKTEIAKSMNMTTTVLRAKISVANSELRKERVNMATKLKEKGYSAPAIARRMGLPSESSVRSLLNDKSRQRTEQLGNLMDVLKKTVEEKKYVDVGGGSELRLGVSEQKLKNACELLKEEGYQIIPILQQQGGTSFKTTVKVLTKEGVTKKEVREHQDEIAIPNFYSEDHGFTVRPIEKPVPIDGKRIMIRYADDPDSGKDRDGTIELRRGVEDLDLHNALYAQVRISVKQDPKAEDGTHYLKGMALYSPDESKMPPGVDIIFNTNKPRGTPIFGETTDTSVLKPIKKDADPANPFGATIKEDDRLILAQRHYTGKDGKEHLSSLNIVNEEGNWGEWAKTLSSQFLGKQRPELIRSQLKEAYDIRKDEFDEIGLLTNPAVKQKLYSSFADDCDAAAVHLKGASMPRQRSQVILPMPWMKENECFAPNYKDGERVVLIRYPHSGLFEIPELTVNNGDKKARDIMRRPDGTFAKDAIGIHPSAAQKLSGADFDGDTVLVIPNDDRRIQTKPLMESLRHFDPDMYQLPPDAPKVDKKHGFNKQREMGDVSNLITDMTIKGADLEEISRAVKHSMVVIDAEKHHLDWRKSALDNGIAELKTLYQGGPRKGASTLISKAKGQAHPNEKKLLTNPAKMTAEQRKRYYEGEQIWVETGGTHFTKDGKEVPNKTNTTKMAEELATKGTAIGLSSGTIQETIYANFADRLHSLANEARKAALMSKPDKYSPSAKKAYEAEVKSLNDKLYLAELNRPLERKAQLLMGAKLKAYIRENRDMDNDEIRKLRGRLIKECRQIVGAKKDPIEITPREWEAIQAHAVSYNTLRKILNNSDMDYIKQLSMPRSQPVMSNAKISRARSMLNQGRTTAEVAEALDVSISTLQKALI